MDFLKLIYITYFLSFCAHSKGTVFDEESNFLVVSRTKAFVDKTMLIKTVFQSGRRMLITAPRKFGKSTNLYMLKIFLSLQSKNNGEILHIFKNLKIYENNSMFFCDNFAQHPVIYVDFKSGTTNSYEEAIAGYRRAIHNAYLEHKYLIDSQKLLRSDKEACEMWCGGNSFEQKGEGRIVSGLAELARMLKEHFNKEVMLLIDEYDSIINNALFQIESNSQFRGIISLTSDILTRLLKGNTNVQLAVVTGVSYITTTGLSDINNLKRYRFLDDHPFVSFYGLTEDEVGQLFHKDDFKSQSIRRELANKLYNGYVCKRGRRMYNTFSFLSFMETNKAIPHWDTTDYASIILSMLDYPEMANVIKLLLDGESINITMYDTISLREVLELKDLYSQRKKNLKLESDLIISHLLELGLLTYDQTFKNTDFSVDNQVEQIQVKIPNQEVHYIIFKKFKVYFIKKYDLPSPFRFANYATFIEGLINFMKSMKEHCKKYLDVFCKAAAVEAGKTVLAGFRSSKTTKNKLV